MAKKITSKAISESPGPGPAAPYGYTAAGNVHKVPLKSQAKAPVPKKVTRPKKKVPSKIVTKSPTPSTEEREELDKKTYFKIWFIKQHLKVHAKALLAEDESVIEGQGLEAIAEYIDDVVENLNKVVPRVPTGDSTSPLSSPPQL
ncbi:hypothetical protein Slin14017_G021480 [Septoria linicola]|nr:hypothetical protein Slin14017_G021480 [Septoria linicola]